jgi:hypothetical protein
MGWVVVVAQARQRPTPGLDNNKGVLEKAPKMFGVL